MKYTCYIYTFLYFLYQIVANFGRAACTKRCLKALKTLDFCGAKWRIYAALAPLTPKIQAHDRVTEIGACLKAGADFFLFPLSYFMAIFLGPILKIV